MVVATGAKGLLSYRLAFPEPKLQWKVDFKDAFTSPVIAGERVYVFGGAYGRPGKGRALCLDLNAGAIVWEYSLKAAQHSSPVAVDGRILITNLADLLILRSSDRAWDLLGQADLGVRKWTSPALVDGRVFLRTPNGVACYDLRRQLTDS